RGRVRPPLQQPTDAGLRAVREVALEFGPGGGEGGPAVEVNHAPEVPRGLAVGLVRSPVLEGHASLLQERLGGHVAEILRFAPAEAAAEGQLTLAVGQAVLLAGQQRLDAEPALPVRLDGSGGIVEPRPPPLRAEPQLQFDAGPRLPARINQAA